MKQTLVTLWVLLMAFFLAGCETAEQAKSRIESQLPPGCTVKDLGQYGRLDTLIVVSCEGKHVNNQNFQFGQIEGKLVVQKRFATVYIDELDRP